MNFCLLSEDHIIEEVVLSNVLRHQRITCVICDKKVFLTQQETDAHVMFSDPQFSDSARMCSCHAWFILSLALLQSPHMHLLYSVKAVAVLHIQLGSLHKLFFFFQTHMSLSTVNLEMPGILDPGFRHDVSEDKFPNSCNVFILYYLFIHRCFSSHPWYLFLHPKKTEDRK